jgi:hypothetical protein
MRVFIIKYEYIEQIKNNPNLANTSDEGIQSCYENCFKSTSCYSIINSTNDCFQMNSTDLNENECKDKICILMNRNES